MSDVNASAQRLEQLVGEPLSTTAAAYDAAALGTLADALESAMERQHVALERVIEGTVHAVPRPLRPVVKRVLG